MVNSESILFINGEIEYVDQMSRYLSEIGYEAFGTVSTAEAFAIISSKHPKIIFFSYALPGMKGDKFIEEAKKICPASHYILVTGWSDDNILDHMKSKGVQIILEKPVDLTSVTEIVKKYISPPSITK